MNPLQKIQSALIFAVALGSTDADAVYLDPDGLGQALIYSYYTVRPAQGNAFNTYLSVANTTGDAKVIRVRLREGRAGREVLSFNLYLSQFDMWTGAVVSHGAQGAKLLSADTGCTNPPAATSIARVREFTLSNATFSGANSDGLGDELDRVREGYVEMIEMATLDPDSDFAEAIAPFDGIPDDCSRVQGASVPLADALRPPTGGLMGTLTLINVASGMDFTVNAEALAALSTDPFYRDYPDPYPDLNAAEVRPVSHIITGGKSHALQWARGVDAVSSVFMAMGVLNEYVRDRTTASQTDWVVTFPTRRFYSNGEVPFVPPRAWNTQMAWYDRSGRGTGSDTCGFGGQVCIHPTFQVASVLPFLAGEVAASPVLGSKNMATELSDTPVLFESGWAELTFWSGSDVSLQSGAGSTVQDHGSGVVETGAFRVFGLPVVGFMLRTFQNGLLTCGSRTCQGNYGGSFAHRYRRSITPVVP